MTKCLECDKVLILYQKEDGTTMTEQKQARVGIGVLIFRDGKVLLGKRKGAHGQGEYGGPGGHLEFGESFDECARREILEETGMEVGEIHFLCLTNLTQYDGRHYVDIGLVAYWESGEAQVMEPERCDSWDWYDLEDLPAPLFGAVDHYLEAHKPGGRIFFDS